MNKKLLSCMISLSLGATSINSQAATCPSNIENHYPDSAPAWQKIAVPMMSQIRYGGGLAVAHRLQH